MTVERYGAWPSPLTPADAVAGAPRFGDVSVVDGPDGPVVRWTEGRPSEGGRSALVEWRAGERADVASSASVRTRMNEYGGGSFWVLPAAEPGGPHSGHPRSWAQTLFSSIPVPSNNPISRTPPSATVGGP